MIKTHHGINSLPRGGNIDPDIIILQDWVTQDVGLHPTSGTIPSASFDPDGPLDVNGTGWSGTPYVINAFIGYTKTTDKSKRLVYSDGLSAFNLCDGNTSFTIEGWVNVTDRANTWSGERAGEVFSLFGSKDFQICTFDSDFDVYNVGRTGLMILSGSAQINKWHHVALMCDGGNYWSSLDGVITRTSTPLKTFTAESFCIGNRWYGSAAGSTYPLPRIKYAQVCLTKRAKWTENFTPPTKPYCLGME